jgi:hypothetical protein
VLLLSAIASYQSGILQFEKAMRPDGCMAFVRLILTA